ncbi:MAG: hypothetical protein OXF04_07820 [bacterium]|nr:hypothetical protein [bacterium]
MLVWAAPGSQAQANTPPDADAGIDRTVGPGAAVTLTGAGSYDVDGSIARYVWGIETGPYDHINIGEADGTVNDDTSTPGAWFRVPSEAFVESRVGDDDPQKYEIVVRLTVTDDDGATATDTVTIRINQAPVADIQVYAGLRDGDDGDVADADLGDRGLFPVDAVIDGPGENGNRDNEWDVKEGAWLELDGSASTDEGPTGMPAVYQWTLVRSPDGLTGYAPSRTTASATGQRLVVPTGNPEVFNFGDLDRDGTPNEAGDPDASPPQVAETVSRFTLPTNVASGAPVTVFYRLTVCDGVDGVVSEFSADITDDGDEDCTGRTGSALVRIVVHDASSAPEVTFSPTSGAVLTAASTARGDAAPQATVGQFTGVENQFIVAAGSTVRLTATVEDDDQTGGGHTARWTGATQGSSPTTATVRVPADAADGDTIDGSVTVTDNTRLSTTATFQLLVGQNTPPTAGGVDANMGSIDNPGTTPPTPVIYVHKVTDGFQSQKDGSTVTLRGVGNDPDGDSIVTAWALMEGPDHARLQSTISTWITAIEAIDPSGDADTRATARATASGAALAFVGAALQDMQEPDEPLFELNGALTDTVSFDVPNLGKDDKGTLLLFTVIDSNGVADVQFIYVYVSADDDKPNADAGADQQVEPGSFVRLNGSASSDPDTGDDISHRWEYVGAEMDPLPGARSPLSQAEIDELDGWILDKDGSTAGGTIDYIVGDNFILKQGESSNNLKSTTSAYPYFDAPELTGFNNIKLTFRLTVADGEDLNSDGDEEDSVSNVVESVVDIDVNRDGDKDDTFLGVIERFAGNFDTDTVTITVVNRFYSGSIPGPDFCTNRSLGGPQTFAFDSDKDGVADTCALNTTRRATVARQNALETLAALNRSEFNAAVLAVCAGSEFKQADYGDDPGDLDGDVCETERPSPPPAAADPATAETYFSGTVTGPDFCTNFSLGGARSYANDSDGDGVADQCSLATTRREAIARQRALGDFMVDPLTDEQSGTLTAILRLFALNNGYAGRDTDQQNEHNMLAKAHAGRASDASAAVLTADEVITAGTTSTSLQTTQRNAERWANTLAAACRALGSQDFGDAPSALARGACSPSPATGQPLS